MYKIPAKTLFLGQSLVFMPECHSTNSELVKLLSEGDAVEGMVVITSNQTAGRGQRGNVWVIEPGSNLTFSILLNPTFLGVTDQFLLSKAIALGVHAYLSSKVNAGVKIKWPNDILIKGKKVCGILIENHVNKTVLRNSIVGIGLNVNQQSFEYTNASSLKNFTGVHHDLEEELPLLLSFLEAKYLLLKQNKLSELNQAYLSKLYWLDELHWFSDGQGEFEGMIKGVNEFGRIVIQGDDGQKTFDVKEVQYLR